MTAGRAAMHLDVLDHGEALLTEAYSIMQDTTGDASSPDHAHTMTSSILFLGDAALLRGDLNRSKTLFTRVLNLAEQHSMPIHATLATMNLGKIALATGDLQDAQVLLEAALAGHQLLSGPAGQAFAHLYLGELFLARGALPDAMRHFHLAFTPFAAASNPDKVVWTLEGLAGAVANSQPADAARLLGAAETISRDEYPGHVPEHDARRLAHLIEEVRARLGEAAFAAAWEDGSRLDLDELRAKVQALVESVANVPDAAPAQVATHGLTPRELDVLRLIATGRSNREIAAALFISVPTVKRHITTILGKLDLPSRSAATAWAHTHKLV
jgi:ATP/maltotriose-dependent transcriptional regulator MalT